MTQFTANVLSRLTFAMLGILLAISCKNKIEESPTAPIGLQCEYMENPVGVDSETPRFRWRSNVVQDEYRIVVDEDSVQVSNGKGTIWDSGQLKGSDNLAVYAGSRLKPYTRYFWTVQVWSDGETRTSAVASFETGLKEESNWKGNWITDSKDVNLKPAGYFRKSFDATKSIRSARAYVAAAGLFELSINGEKIGDHVMDPMYTRFDKTILYVTHDITRSMKQGQNVVGMLLGNGWYNHQSTAVWDFHKAHWRGRPRFCINIRVEYDDNTVETIVSDTSWKTSLSPVIFNSIYTAEHYDARLEQGGWNAPGFDDNKWASSIEVVNPAARIKSQVLHPIRHVTRIAAHGFKKIDDRKYIFDLGKNIAGVSELTVKGNAGTTIRLKHGEQLDSIGNVDQSNIDVHYRPTDDSDPFQTDIFILKGGDTETFLPRFNYKGFQYVEVTSDQPIELTQSSLSGLEMHSDVPIAGHIQSSSDLINKIWSATNNSYLSNLFGYPTDCPQREKNGWTGDAHIASETGLYNFDAITIYEKWLADHRDEQQDNGVLPSIIPTAGWGYEWGNGPDWTSTIAIIPWNLYLFYGDVRPLQENYENLKRYVDHITEISPKGTTDWGLGDWVPVKSVTPKELTSSLYYYADTRILSKAASILNKPEDAKHYEALAATIADAINAKFLNKTEGIYGKGLQTELSAPLFWGIVPDDVKEKVVNNLVKRIHSDGDHIDVGLLGTKVILNALSENGQAELAYTLASQETFPSWGYWIRNGATSLFENWPIDAKSDISRNHIMFGEIGAWLYKSPGGIKPDAAAPGFKHVLLEPHFMHALQSFEARHTGPYGEIVSSWSRSGDQIHYTATVPANSNATLRVLAETIDITSKTNVEVTTEGPQKVVKLPAGTHTFEIVQ
ncbi:family 78 glycoside hydrolase catalytic domain [Chryseolinea sp. T2]|uniref:alpha-L-rhamnosidase n=1 Tax=Chryseolinea sp. T2 TaxID=3129255 RepID=UPI0030775786